MNDTAKMSRGLRVNEELQRRLTESVGKSPSSQGSGETAPRPALREDDPRARAAARAAELRAHGAADDVGSDEFYIPPDIVPDGWEYQWKTHSILNQEQGTYLMQLAREGWTPVPSNRHPEMMHKGAGNDPIMRKGMILMECPREIVDERRRIQQKAARDQVRFKESQIAGTPDGTMTRDHAQARPKINKSFEPMPIPE